MPAGVASTNLTEASVVTDVLGNQSGESVRIPVARLAQQLSLDAIVVNKETRALLDADLSWGDGVRGAVWGDPTEALRGVYLKLGAWGTGSWTRIGDVPQSALTEAQLAAKAARDMPIITLQSSGDAAAQTAALPAGVTLTQGLMVMLFSGNTNTGAMTLNGLPILRQTGGALLPADVPASIGLLLRCSNGATQWRIVGRSAEDPATTAAIGGRAPLLQTLPLAAADGGSANAQVSTAPPGMTGYAPSQVFLWQATATNTAPDPTLDVGGFGPRTLKAATGGTLSAGDVRVASLYQLRVMADGTTLRIIATLPSDVAAQITAALTPAIAPLARNGDVSQVNLCDWITRPFVNAQATRVVLADGTPGVQVSGTAASGRFARIPRDAINGETFSAGAVVDFSDVAGRILAMQMTAALTEIRDLSDGNGDYRTQLNITAGMANAPLSVLDKPLAPTCAFVDLYSDMGSGVTGTIRIKEDWVSAGAKRFAFPTPDFMTSGRVCHVSPTGTLGAAGTAAAPVNTLRRAMATGASTIILADGVYAAANMLIDGNMFGGIDLIAAPGAMPIIRGGDIVTGFTAVPGRTDVYQAALATAPAMHHASTPRGFVWLIGVPWSEISAADRRTQHHGRSHRCPHMPFYAGPTSLDTLEAAARVSWWWSSGVLYVRSVPGVDPLTMAVRVPRGDGITNRRQQNKLSALGITWEFVGLTCDNMARYDFEGINVIGAPVDGLSLDWVSGTDRFCSVIGSSNDNWNGHGTTGDTPGRQDGRASIDYFLHSIEPYSCLAHDDGRSLHERGRGRVDGGLFEQCGSTGCAPAGGAEDGYYGTEIVGCGWDTGAGSGGERAGIAAVNPVIDDGTGTRVECRGVIIRDCPRGFYVGVGASHRMELWDTWTIGCTEHALYAAAAGASIVHHNHTDIGSAALKGGPGMAGIVAANGTVVT
ncbi:hypothetical protein [Pseudotabrizicola algicola]|uniref:Uncharacterized protein n=1 Tax=Pseudotabrizicola algicola TaxID=2709381 RepID=A0A6B3RWU1_9RHOB|nr:hypothetical protein [Pseudotabrizicola algicola]NEX47592.1 hypothetical protein [Pseudotabrizicola algicola]